MKKQQQALQKAAGKTLKLALLYRPYIEVPFSNSSLPHSIPVAVFSVLSALWRVRYTALASLLQRFERQGPL